MVSESFFNLIWMEFNICKRRQMKLIIWKAQVNTYIY